MPPGPGAVSYTHLDVYKRQLWIKVKETKGVDLANLKGDEFE